MGSISSTYDVTSMKQRTSDFIDDWKERNFKIENVEIYHNTYET